MSLFKVQRVEDLDLRVIHVRAAGTFKEFVALLDREIGPPPTRHIIWDFAPGALKLLTTEELKGFVPERRERLNQQSGGRTVLVTHQPAERAFAKWYMTFVRSQSDGGVTFFVADSLDEAMELIRDAPGRV